MTNNKQNPGCLPRFMQFLFNDQSEFSGKPISANYSNPLIYDEEWDDEEALPYRVRDDFLSNAELSFYRVLKSVVQQNAVIMTKVRLADVFFVSKPNENRHYFNRIIQKHIDFLLCEPQTLKPICGIELDDRSHNQRQVRDDFVNAVFEAANLPLIRIPTQRAYNTVQLSETLAPVLESHQASLPPQELTSTHSQLTTDVPVCPKCGIKMVLRTASKGKYQGRQFYACSNYPR
ncbi:MAG: DUF2726 domain-containing protein, partial [Taibaiella sp.]|nr:DUF2726 domain-containing protein [Taibaiella sp.]